MITYGMIGTYPPTDGALATFTDRLRTGLLADHADEVRIVRAGEPPHQGEPAEVVARFVNGRTDTGPAVTALNECDIAVIHHDFGLYGGADGQDVLSVVGRLRVPAIAVLHTVPESPAPHEREVLEELMDRADAIVVTSDTASDRLLAGYAVDAAKIAVIMASGARSPATGSDWAAMAAGYGRLAALLRADRGVLLV